MNRFGSRSNEGRVNIPSARIDLPAAVYAQQPEPIQARTVAAASHAQQPELIQACTDSVAATGYAQQPEQVQEQVGVKKKLQVDPLLTLLQVSRDIVSRQSPMPRATANIRKIIHSPTPTNATDLYREIIEHNPGLENMLVGQPKMFSATIAMLTFYPLAPVPRDVKGFGVRLRLTEYQDRGGGRGGRGGRGSGRASGRGRGRGRYV